MEDFANDVYNFYCYYTTNDKFLEKVRRKIEKKNSEIEKLENDVETKENNILKLQEERIMIEEKVKSLNSDYEMVKIEKDALDAQCIKLGETIDDLSKEKEKLQQDVSSMKGQHEASVQEISKMRGVIILKNDAIKQHEEEKSTSILLVEELTTGKDAFESKCMKLDETIVVLEADKKKLHDELSSANNRCSDANADLINMEREIESKDLEIKRLQDDQAATNKRLEEKIQLSKMLIDKISQSEDNLTALASETEIIKNQREALEHKCDQLDKTVETIITEKNALVAENLLIRHQIDEAQAKNSSLEKTIKDLESLTSDRDNAVSAAAELVTENNELRLKLNEIEAEKKMIQVRVSELEEKKTQLQEANKGLSEKDQQIKILEAKIEVMKVKDKSEIDLSRVDKLTKEMESQANLDREIIELLERRESEEQIKLVKEAERQIMELKVVLNEARQDLKKLEKDNANYARYELEKVHEQILRADLKSSESLQTIKYLQNQLEIVRNSEAKLKQELLGVCKESHEYRVYFLKMYKQKEFEVHKLNKEISSIQYSLATKNAHLSACKGEVLEWKEKFYELREKCRRLEKEKVMYLEKIKSVSQEIVSTRTKLMSA